MVMCKVRVYVPHGGFEADVQQVWVQGGAVRGVAKRGNSLAARGLKKTELARKGFLEALKRTGLVTEACEIVGIARRTPYDWAKKSEEFAETMEVARADGEKLLLDEVRKEVRRRGLEGWDDPIVYQGKISKTKDPRTGEIVPLTVRKWSDNLLMFWGKYLDARFRDNFPAVSTQVGDVRFQVNVFTGEAPPRRPNDGSPADGEQSQVVDLGPGSRRGS